VLALGVSEMMYAAFPKATEGELSRRLAELVRKETCADVAVALDMGSAVRVGGGKQGTRSTINILGDVCEAVIAALYLDGGMEAARRFIEANWRVRMLAVEGPRRDAKTALQEWAQGRGLAAPVYEIVGRSGPDHALRFEVEVKVESLPVYHGTGRTRREAEQDAAALALLSQGVWKAAGDVE
jgi:ribonuclease-3